MAKVLVVRKPDRTIHRVPIENKARIMSSNNKLKENDKWVLEEMEENEAAKLPYIDSHFVAASSAQKVIKDKDAQIKELEAKIALMSASQPAETATDKIARINASENAESVTAIFANDDRKTVKDAADKMMASFSK